MKLYEILNSLGYSAKLIEDKSIFDISFMQFCEGRHKKEMILRKVESHNIIDPTVYNPEKFINVYQALSDGKAGMILGPSKRAIKVNPLHPDEKSDSELSWKSFGTVSNLGNLKLKFRKLYNKSGLYEISGWDTGFLFKNMTPIIERVLDEYVKGLRGETNFNWYELYIILKEGMVKSKYDYENRIQSDNKFFPDIYKLIAQQSKLKRFTKKELKLTSNEREIYYARYPDAVAVGVERGKKSPTLLEFILFMIIKLWHDEAEKGLSDREVASAQFRQDSMSQRDKDEKDGSYTGDLKIPKNIGLSDQDIIKKAKKGILE